MPCTPPARSAPAPYDVVGIGYCSEDTLLVVERYPPRNHKAEVTRLERSGGGQVATALCALSRLGRRTAFHGRLGGDPAGIRARDLLKAAGVDARGALFTPGVETQQAFIVVDRESGERTIFWRRPPELELTPADVDADLVTGARLVHVDGHERGALRAVQLARDAGITTSMDAEKATPLQREMLPFVDLLVAAEPFAGNLLGEADPLRALPRLRGLGPREVVLTLGARGAVATDGRETIEEPAFPMADAVDSTGAGDVFHAGYIHAHLEGFALRRKVRFANACAALSLRGLGGRTALPTLAEATALADSRGPEGSGAGMRGPHTP